MTPDPELEARLRALADTEEAPGTTDATAARIVARRAQGERVALPTASPRRMPGWLVAGAAAVLLLGVSLVRTDRQTWVAAPAPAPAAPDTALQVSSMGGFMLPAPLLAQATPEPRYPRVGAAGGERLRPGRWFYNSPMLDRPFQPGDTAYGYAIERATFDGAPAWLALGGRRLPTGAIDWSLDSLWLSLDSLRPIRQVRRFGDNGRVEKIYREDEVLIGETVNGYTSWRNRPIIDPQRNPAEGSTVHWYQFVATLRSGELEIGWRRSLEVPFIIKTGNAWGYYLDLRIVSAEAVTVPAGRFDCWKVVIGQEDRGHLLWVDKRHGWIVAQSSVWGGRERYRQELVWGEDVE